jgi:putative membrane protein
MTRAGKIALIVGGSVLAVLIVAAIVAGLFWGRNGGYGYGGMMGWNFGGGWWMMGLGMVVFWGLVIWGVIALIQGSGARHTDEPTRGESAMDVLKRRYAAGEINKEEFEQKRKDLLG